MLTLAITFYELLARVLRAPYVGSFMGARTKRQDILYFIWNGAEGADHEFGHIGNNEDVNGIAHGHVQSGSMCGIELWEEHIGPLGKTREGLSRKC